MKKTVLKLFLFALTLSVTVSCSDDKEQPGPLDLELRTPEIYVPAGSVANAVLTGNGSYSFTGYNSEIVTVDPDQVTEDGVGYIFVKGLKPGSTTVKITDVLTKQTCELKVHVTYAYEAFLVCATALEASWSDSSGDNPEISENVMGVLSEYDLLHQYNVLCLIRGTKHFLVIDIEEDASVSRRGEYKLDFPELELIYLNEIDGGGPPPYAPVHYLTIICSEVYKERFLASFNAQTDNRSAGLGLQDTRMNMGGSGLPQANFRFTQDLTWRFTGLEGAQYGPIDHAGTRVDAYWPISGDVICKRIIESGF